MIPTLALIALVLLALTTAASARTVEQRISFLEERQAVHQYICRHGAHATQRFHCKALRWTRRELRQAVDEKHARDYTVPVWPWLTLAHCEQRAGVRLDQVVWTAFSETYEGGYGFTHDAWDQHRLSWMPGSANVATPRVQTIVARRIQAVAGWGAWPACSIRLGLR